jgi:hypothetical protein
MRSKCGRANKDELRHEAHAVLNITWLALDIQLARGVRDNRSDSTWPSSELTVFISAPNGSRYRRLGEPTDETEKTPHLDLLFWRCPPAVRCTLCWAHFPLQMTRDAI